MDPMDSILDEMPSTQVGVSNSEALAAHKCNRAWMYGFHPQANYKLKDFGDARTRGIIGHRALEMFFDDLRQEVDYDSAAQGALQYIQDERTKILMAGDFANLKRLELLNELHTILKNYFEHGREQIEQWEILEVEAFHAMEWTGENDFYLPIRLDVTVYWKQGTEFYGETSPLDHKFVHDFWKPVNFKLNSQLPLQIRALRESRFKEKPAPVVRRAIVNQLRTRKMKNPSPSDLFKVVTWDYSSARIDRVFQNHLRTAVRLAYMKRLPFEEVAEVVDAALGSKSCDFCDFKDWCDQDFEGGDPSSIIAALFEPSDYGYPPLEEIRRER